MRNFASLVVAVSVVALSAGFFRPRHLPAEPDLASYRCRHLSIQGLHLGQWMPSGPVPRHLESAAAVDATSFHYELTSNRRVEFLYGRQLELDGVIVARAGDTVDVLNQTPVTAMLGSSIQEEIPGLGFFSCLLKVWLAEDSKHITGFAFFLDPESFEE